MRNTKIVRLSIAALAASVSAAACVGTIGEAPSSAGSGAASAPGAGGTSATGAGGAVGAAGLPCDVATLLANRCTICHGTTPVAGVPMSLVTYADLIAPAKSDASKTNAEMAVVRMMSTTTPMPPAGSAPATPTEIAAVQSWIAAGYPMTGCGTGTPPDPFGAAPTCTSMMTWTRGTEGSPNMEPGMACISCHATTGGEAPPFALAGTVYPTAHEPDLCNGASGTGGIQVIITGANGATIPLTPNGVGNFSYEGTVALPYTAKVTYMGRERAMGTAQTSGDCNGCHTQTGAMSAPGRILLP
jgi:hypothetical protein